MKILQQFFSTLGNIFDYFVEEPHYNGAVDSQNNVPLPRGLGSSRFGDGQCCAADRLNSSYSNVSQSGVDER